MEFLGHNTTRDGYTIIKSYIEPIMYWLLIASQYEALSFLRSANYYAEFIPYFATKAKPLYDVLKHPGHDKAIILFSSDEKISIEK